MMMMMYRLLVVLKAQQFVAADDVVYAEDEAVDVANVVVENVEAVLVISLHVDVIVVDQAGLA